MSKHHLKMSVIRSKETTNSIIANFLHDREKRKQPRPIPYPRQKHKKVKQSLHPSIRIIRPHNTIISLKQTYTTINPQPQNFIFTTTIIPSKKEFIQRPPHNSLTRTPSIAKPRLHQRRHYWAITNSHEYSTSYSSKVISSEFEGSAWFTTWTEY